MKRPTFHELKIYHLYSIVSDVCMHPLIINHILSLQGFERLPEIPFSLIESVLATEKKKDSAAAQCTIAIMEEFNL